QQAFRCTSGGQVLPHPRQHEAGGAQQHADPDQGRGKAGSVEADDGGLRHRRILAGATRIESRSHRTAARRMGARMTAPLHVVILAAGQRKRMKTARPKVLQPAAGQPMLAHVVATARALSPAAIHVVHGHGGDQVRAAFDGDAGLSWVEQARQLGTGHAVQQALPAIPAGSRVLVLYGDVPLITADTLRRLLASPGALAVLAAELDDPTGYGRIVRDTHGNVERIVEQKDADEAQRRIGLVNTGVIVADGNALGRWLSALRNDNAQGEYYLTDVFAQAAAEYCAAEIVVVGDPMETEGANDPWQLAQLERAFQR